MISIDCARFCYVIEGCWSLWIVKVDRSYGDHY